MSAATVHALFLEQRRAYIGGTDIGAITGISPWASALSVYLDKTAPEQAEQKDSLQMRRGLALERFIADEFERDPRYAGMVTYHPKPIVRTDWGFPAGASLDYVVAEREHPRTPVGILECKTAFRFGWRDWDEANADLPDHYFCQVQHYLAVTGLPVCYGAADVGDEKLRIIPILADLPLQQHLIEAGRRFWTEHVEKGVPPAPQGSKADSEALGRMYAETVPEPAIALPQAEETLSTYLAWKFKAEEASREAEKAKQELCAAMGEYENAVIGSWRATWRKQTTTRIDSKRLKAEKPEIAAEYAKTSESRPFKLTDIAEMKNA